jgi:glucan phosphoethanolaminetransferase (alkaline phosphatase superfamily)
MATFKESLTEAIRYWEPRRLVYNAVLSAIVLTYFVVWLPESKAVLKLDFLLFLFLLAVLANVAYCAAYLVDVFAQSSGLRDTWIRYRWVLLLIGICFAGVITRFFAIAMFQPHVE